MPLVPDTAPAEVKEPTEALFVTPIALLKIPLFARNCPTLQMFELVTVIESFIVARKSLFVDIKLVETLLKETSPLFINKEIG